MRERLDQLQGKANLTMNDAAELIGMAKELLDDLQDGVGVRLNVDGGAAKQIVKILMGKPGNLPLTVEIDPTYDTVPGQVADFIGGDYDGKRFTIPDGVKDLTLKGGQRYEWDGHRMVYVGDK